MKLLFDEITGKTQHYSISDTQWLPTLETGLLLAVTAHFSVSRHDRETVIVKGDLEGRREAACDRCGERVESEFQSDFLYKVTTRNEDVQDLREIECSDDDVVILHLREPVIEIDDILREQVYLAVPLRTLCSDECRGICAGCGVSLNKETCRCEPDNSISPFAVLGKIKKK